MRSGCHCDRVSASQLLIAARADHALDVTSRRKSSSARARAAPPAYGDGPVTHDLCVVAGRTDEVGGHDAGRVVERAADAGPFS